MIIGAGRDKNFGGPGFDVAVFDGRIDDFSGVSGAQDVYLINDLNTADGNLGFDRVRAFEILAFEDALFDTRSGNEERFTTTSNLVARLDDLITSGDIIA